jgi:GST-like protein
MDAALSRNQYLGGDTYSIADIAAYPWVVTANTFLADVLSAQIAAKPDLQDWLARVGARPAVQRGMAIPAV